MPSTNQDFQPNNVWGTTTPSGGEEELTLPSGQTCRAKKMSIEDMLQAGLLVEMDAITAMVTKHIKKTKGAKNVTQAAEDINVGSLMRDPRAIGELVMMLDRLLPHVVVSPTVRLHFTEQTVGKTKVTKMIPVDDREPGIYTDMVGLEDKMFLFDWAAGGLGTMLAFRE